MRRIIPFIFLAFAGFSQAELVLVVNKNVPLDAVTKAEVKQLFLGKSRTLHNLTLTPVELKNGTPKSMFYSKVLGKSESQIRSYWSRMIFSGRATPPKQLASKQELVSLIATDTQWIGYMERSEVPSSIKTISIQ